MTAADWIAVVGLALTLLIAASGAFGYLLKENRAARRESETALGTLRNDFAAKAEELRKDAVATLNQSLRELEARFCRVEEEQRGNATQITSLLRDHYLPIRDFSRHEAYQKEDIREIKALVGNLHKGQDELRELIIERLK
jgi:uncharacterized protein HemX